MSCPSLVTVEDVHRHYGPVHAVRGVSFEVRRGEVLGFLGPNGAGKSTTMQIVCGALAPSRGRVTVSGIDMLDAPRAAKARLGYLPERPPLYPDLTVDEYLRYCGRLRGVPRARIGAAVERARARCGLGPVGRRLLGNLSKGFQQRAAIAQAIVHEPEVVVLDEPTAGLDPIQIREIRVLVRELGRERAVVLSTHILPEVQTTCDRVQIIHQGRLVLSESIALLGEDAAACLRARFRHPPLPETLRAVPGVDRVETPADGRVRIHHRDPAVAERLAERAARAGWGLLELTPERRSLEEIFIALTCGDDPRPPAAEAGRAQEPGAAVESPPPHPAPPPEAA